MKRQNLLSPPIPPYHPGFFFDGLHITLNPITLAHSEPSGINCQVISWKRVYASATGGEPMDLMAEG